MQLPTLPDKPPRWAIPVFHGSVFVLVILVVFLRNTSMEGLK